MNRLGPFSGSGVMQGTDRSSMWYQVSAPIGNTIRTNLCKTAVTIRLTSTNLVYYNWGAKKHARPVRHAWFNTNHEDKYWHIYSKYSDHQFTPKYLELYVMWNLIISDWRGQKFEAMHGIIICVCCIDEWVFETWHKGNSWGRAGLNPLNQGIRESWRGRLTEKKLILLWAVVRGIKIGHIRPRQYKILLFYQLCWFWMCQQSQCVFTTTLRRQHMASHPLSTAGC